MSVLGMLLFPVGYAPTNDGAVVPGGKLTFSRTGTSTLQDTFSDSTLGVANANPVVLNTEGYLDTQIYGTPATGFKYRVKLTDANDVEIWTRDDVTMGAADAYSLNGTVGSSYPVVQTGSFTGTLTGFGTPPTGTINYILIGNFCILWPQSAITGTSNSTAMTLTGIPAACRPAVIKELPLIAAVDSGSTVSAFAQVGTAGTITFYTDEPLSTTGWTNSGTKGLGTVVMAYPLT